MRIEIKYLYPVKKIKYIYMSTLKNKIKISFEKYKIMDKLKFEFVFMQID